MNCSMEIWGGWGYPDWVLVCFLLYRICYPNLDKLFELCPFMETVILHENRVDGFFLAHTHFPEIVNFDIIFTLLE